MEVSQLKIEELLWLFTFSLTLYLTTNDPDEFIFQMFLQLSISQISIHRSRTNEEWSINTESHGKNSSFIMFI